MAKLRLADRCARFCEMTPRYLIILLLIWVYYISVGSIIIQYEILYMRNYFKAFLLCISFHSVWLPCLWSLSVTCSIGPGYVEPGVIQLPTQSAPPRNDEKASPYAAVPLHPPDSLRNRSPSVSDQSEDGSTIINIDVEEEQLDEKTLGSAPERTGLLPAATFTTKSNGATRFCRKCQLSKPDRAHHDRMSGRCESFLNSMHSY